eukprot:GFUD01138713.1.p1 GENE.GFUD01138713.1~~GFUD01138713.1.p1  ORF type:complete len:127 (-),score=25.04 GFUD01138713.1:8-388(-)
MSNVDVNVDFVSNHSEDEMMIPKYQDLIGSTPLVDITSLASPRVPGVKVLGKCEFLNPGFSMKDRIVKHIFDKAEKNGLLKPGGTGWGQIQQLVLTNLYFFDIIFAVNFLIKLTVMEAVDFQMKTR